MKFCNSIILTYAFLFSSLNAVELSELALIPVPKSVNTEKSSEFPLSSISFEKLSAENQALLPTIKNWFPKISTTKKTKFQIKFGQDENILPKNAPAGSYQILPRDFGILILANEQEGKIHALATLKQLQNDKTIKRISIVDEPRFAYRGFMLDSARHMQTPEQIKRLLDQMAQLKFNKFHWHLTDDDGWRVPIDQFPKLTSVGGFMDPTGRAQERNGFYTKEQIKDLVAYAKNLGIQIIPEIDVPRHSSAFIEAYPEFLCPTNQGKPTMRERDQAKDPHEVLCLGNDKILDVLEIIFTETAELFSTKIVHIGGDEADMKFWAACPLCQKLRKELGCKDMPTLQAEWMKKLAQRLDKKGIQSIIWVESHQSGLPDNVIAQGWRGDLTQSVAAANAGLQTICSDGGGRGYAYLDFPETGNNWRPSWMPTLSLKQVYQYDIPLEKIQPDKRKNIIGGEGALWTEHILFQDLDKMLYPRLFAISEKLWSPTESKNWENFQQRLALIRPTWEKTIAFHPDWKRPEPKDFSVSTSLSHLKQFYPELVIDNNDVTYFISDAPPKAGATFSVSPKKPTGKQIEIISGSHYSWNEPNGKLVDVEVHATTTDGKSHFLGTTYDGYFSKKLDSPIQKIELKFTKDHKNRVVIPEIRFLP